MDEKLTTIHDKTDEAMAGVVELTGELYLDLTVKFPSKYFRGNRYTIVVYDYYINAIITEAMKNLEWKSIVNTY